MKWIGLTGGIATGKSTAARLIEGRGFPVIDADQISHVLTQTGKSGYQEIVSHFGNEVLNADKSLNRQKLGHIIFSDAHQKIKLESILHPLIKAEVQQKRREYKEQGNVVCFYDVPLLFEKSMQSQFDVTVFVWCWPPQQLGRLMERSGLTKVEAELRIANQMPLIDKVKLSNYCLDNSSVPEALDKQLDILLKRLISN